MFRAVKLQHMIETLDGRISIPMSNMFLICLTLCDNTYMTSTVQYVKKIVHITRNVYDII